MKASVAVNLDFVLDGLIAQHEGCPEIVRDRVQQVLGCNVAIAAVKERLEKVAGYRARLRALQQLPVVEQRTAEWYKMREGLMTASDLAQALGCAKFGTPRDFLVKKCGYEVVPFDHSCPPLKWGTMFEPLANDFYQQLAHTRVHEFGLIPHPDIQWFGCSPDGISDMGVMLEIKCPYRRRITGDIIPQYYHQIQGQLEVAGLKECDFIECAFKECADEAEWLAITPADALAKGIILEQDLGDRYEYRYSPWGVSASDALAWAREDISSSWRMRFYWLDHFHLTRVYHDPDFIREKLAAAKQVWDKVCMYRHNKDMYDLFVGRGKTSLTSQPRSAKAPQFTAYAFVD